MFGRILSTNAAGPDRRGMVVLVDPAMTGRPYKEACRRRGLPTTSLYTLDEALLASYDRDYRWEDEHVIHAADANQAVRQLIGPVLAVVPTTEPSVEMGDLLSELLAVPGNPLATASARRDKVAMRRHAQLGGLRVPSFEVATRAEIAATAERMGFPAIVKPQRGAGSHGVMVLSESGGTLELPAHDLFGGVNQNWLVEEYVRGRELAVNCFSQNGRHRVLDIWEKRQPHDADYDQPYWDLVQLRPDDPDWPAAEDFVLKALDIYQVRIGPSHTEIKLDTVGPCLIELASRLPGAHVADQWILHSAIRPYDDTLAAYLGEDSGLLTRDLGFDAVLGICCLRNDERPGVLTELAGLDKVRQLAGVDMVHTCVASGDFVPLTRDLGSLVGFVLVHGRTTTEIDDLLDAVRHCVRLELE